MAILSNQSVLYTYYVSNILLTFVKNSSGIMGFDQLLIFCAAVPLIPDLQTAGAIQPIP